VNLLEVEIDPEIRLDPDSVRGMPEDLRRHLLITMTIASEKYGCCWKELKWSVSFVDGQPVIRVKKI